MQMVSGWLDVAVEIDVLNKSWDRAGYAPKYIVLHGTAGGSSAQNIAYYFQKSDVAASTHFVIGQDGVIVQCVPTTLAAWGNGVLTAGHAPYLPEGVNPNLYTISIEHVKPSLDNSDQLTDAQQEASFKVIDILCSYHSIPRHSGDASGGIIRHADIDPVNRSRCPGPYPFNALWQFLQKGGSMETITPNMTKSAQDEWNSTAALFGGTPPRYDSGIAAEWRAQVFALKNPGPPLTQEYHSVDWSGQDIIVQEFAHARAEFYWPGKCFWFDAHGQIS